MNSINEYFIVRLLSGKAIYIGEKYTVYLLFYFMVSKWRDLLWYHVHSYFVCVFVCLFQSNVHTTNLWVVVIMAVVELPCELY